MANSAKGLTFFPDSSRSYLTELLPGFMLCLVVGMAATFVSDHYGGPTILYALLMGMSLNYLSQEDQNRFCLPVCPNPSQTSSFICATKLIVSPLPIIVNSARLTS